MNQHTEREQPEREYSKKCKSIYKNSDDLWVVENKMKEEVGRFRTERWAIKWSSVLLNLE